MNAEQLNIVARGILQLSGLSPEEIDKQVNKQKVDKNRQQLKSQPRRSAPKLPKTPPTKPQPAKPLTAADIFGEGRVNRSVNIARNMNPTAGLGILGKLRAGAGVGLLSLLIDPAADLIADNVSRPILEAITGKQIPDIKNIKELGPKGAAQALKTQLADNQTLTSTTTKNSKGGVANIPPAEGQPGSPSYVLPKPAGTGNATTSRLQISSTAAPALPDYNSMSEMERLKIWATTNRKMIESVGTKQQKEILERALGARE